MKSISDSEVRSIIKARSALDVLSGCWNWNFATDNHGYGALRLTNFRGRARFVWKASRVSYLVFRGDIGPGLFVCHTCDNPRCVNPDHLYAGTPQDNVNDMMERGRNVCAPQLGNNHAGKKVVADGKEFGSYRAAAESIGISDNGIRKRIKTGRPGYALLE